jgi:glutathione peroxidase-family protein
MTILAKEVMQLNKLSRLLEVNVILLWMKLKYSDICWHFERIIIKGCLRMMSGFVEFTCVTSLLYCLFYICSFIKWNFTKFIIDKNGQPVERHGPNVDPNVSVAHFPIHNFLHY